MCVCSVMSDSLWPHGLYIALPGSSVHGILQARTLEWVAISFSNAWKWKVKVKSLSRVRLLATPWTAAHQAPPSMGFTRQEYWSGLPFPFPGNLPDSGIEPMFLASPALAGGFFTTCTWENQDNKKYVDIYIYTPHNNPKLKTIVYTYTHTHKEKGIQCNPKDSYQIMREKSKRKRKE